MFDSEIYIYLTKNRVLSKLRIILNTNLDGMIKEKFNCLKIIYIIV